MPHPFKIAVAALTFVMLAVLFFLFNAHQGEKSLRQQREKDLSEAQMLLSEKAGAMTAAIKEKNEREAQLSSQKEIHEKTVRDQEAQLSFLNTTLESLSKENETLKKSAQGLPRRIGDLSRVVEEQKKEKQELLDRISSLESEGRLSSSVDEEEWVPLPVPLASNFNELNLGALVIEKTAGIPSEVEHVDPVHGYILFNAGAEEGMKEGNLVNIVRGSELIGTAVVRRVRSDASAAVLLPQWEKSRVRVGDAISQYAQAEKRLS